VKVLQTVFIALASLAAAGSAFAESTTTTTENLIVTDQDSRENRRPNQNNWCTRWSFDPNQCEHTAGCEFDYFNQICTRRNVIPGPSECAYFHNDPWRCDRTPGCAYDRYSDTCEDDRGGSFPDNQCWRYDRDPRSCNTMRGCSWDNWSNRCMNDNGGWDDPRHPQRTTIHCSSSQYRYQECDAGGRVVSAQLIRRFSNSNCVEGRSWGTTPQGVWVDRGCSAEFEVTFRRW